MDKLIKTIDTLSQTIDTLNKELGTLSCYDIGALIIQGSILVALVVTACFIWNQLKNQNDTLETQNDTLETQNKMLETQNKMLEVQLLKDRITMGWSTDEPITNEHINNVKFLPDNFIPEKYRKNMDELGKYLYLEQVYDYFLYVFTSAEITKDDPLGIDWQKKWIKLLVKDKIFNEIREFHGNSFKDYEDFLQDIEKSANTSSTVIDNDLQEQNKEN
jgi:hypothetical protein